MSRRKDREEAECCAEPSVSPKYDVEGVATVDERGQMVLPKAIRDKAGIRPGDKLAIVTLVRDGKVCCLHLLRTDDLVHGVKDILEPKGG
ncbi:MAG TPA: HgcAB-associated protein [Methanomassiliicoccales archaeon]|jgi:AbrB family looped-hinge helix DNA binding protein|nr:HgcAB-associated protein [Methanomassiliicoccales archaeon]HQQ25094.1 HgcAB-associated protein [Methanomassiliicoccales archaeon]